MNSPQTEQTQPVLEPMTGPSEAEWNELMDHWEKRTRVFRILNVVALAVFLVTTASLMFMMTALFAEPIAIFWIAGFGFLSLALFARMRTGGYYGGHVGHVHVHLHDEPRSD